MNLKTGPHVDRVSNPKGRKGGYPDHCRIVRKVGETSFSNGEEKVLYEGECVFFGSGQMRKFHLGNVVMADFCVEIPYVLVGDNRVRSGDRITVTDRCKDWDVVVATPDQVFWMGTTVYFNETMN